MILQVHEMTDTTAMDKLLAECKFCLLGEKYTKPIEERSRLCRVQIPIMKALEVINFDKETDVAKLENIVKEVKECGIPELETGRKNVV
jgi:hypothetical protein